MSEARITFCGGSGTVTGANFLFDTGDAKYLIDCGAIEREHVCDTANFSAFPYDVSSIDALFVTHAHADHIGRIPRLVKDGYRGVIYSTAATKDLAALMFEDALGIMHSDAQLHGCDVLYEQEDIDKALSLWQGRAYDEPFSIGEASVTLLDAGHILGSSMVRFTRLPAQAGSNRCITFTGDLGNSPEPLLNDTESPAGANYIVMESVYGDRVHEGRSERHEHLRQAIEATRDQRGTLLIPTFSIERTQILLFELNEFIERDGMAPIPVYLDAPLAIQVTNIFHTYHELMNPNIREHFTEGDDPFFFKGLTRTPLVAESRAIHEAPNPKVVIAGAGMSGGGRIREHEKHYLPDKNATILFVGYQAPGTLGRRIEDGEKHVDIDGERVQIRAHVAMLTGYSGHKDRDGLLSFVEGAGENLERVFVTMGEPRASMFLAQRIRDFLGVDAIVPKAGETVTISW